MPSTLGLKPLAQPSLGVEGALTALNVELVQGASVDPPPFPPILGPLLFSEGSGRVLGEAHIHKTEPFDPVPVEVTPVLAVDQAERRRRPTDVASLVDGHRGHHVPAFPVLPVPLNQGSNDRRGVGHHDNDHQHPRENRPNHRCLLFQPAQIVACFQVSVKIG